MKKNKVRSILREPLDEIQKDKVKLVQNDPDYDVFKFDNIYTTIFYDKHQDNQIKGIMQVASSTEDKRTNQYHTASDEYKGALELQNLIVLMLIIKYGRINVIKFIRPYFMISIKTIKLKELC